MRRMRAGSRPARPAARAMRSRTSASRARSATASITTSCSCATSALAVAALGPSGASFRYVSNSVAGLRQLALVHERHAELVVRLGVVRVRGDRRLELLLRLGNLAGVPEDDALVVERVGVAAAQRRRARRPSARVAFALAAAAWSNLRCAL